MSPPAASRAPRLPGAGAPVLDAWAPFSLPPICLETPLTWHPSVSRWTHRAARVRWESLTGAPLEINWLWEPAFAPDDRARVHQKLAAQWAREQAAAARQAEQNKLKFEWTGETKPLSEFAGVELEGHARTYSWDGQPACLAVTHLAGPGFQAYLDAAFCLTETDGELRHVVRRVLRSLAAGAAKPPRRLILPGLDLELPQDYSVDGVRGREGHLYVDLAARARRVQLVRLAFAEWHLARGEKPLYAALARLLFDRGEPGESDHVTIHPGDAPPPLFGRTPARPPAGEEAEVHEHAGVCFSEQRACHLRAGDWVTRRLGRRFSGAASVLVWTCPLSHAVWGLGARAGTDDAAEVLREMAARLSCHGPPPLGQPDWRPAISATARSQPGEVSPPLQPGKEEKLPSALLRRRQLRFRVRARPEVRLEKSSRDGSADLVYQGAPATGVVARLLRGNASPRPVHRRLALDPIGCRIWELLAPGPTIGDLLADLSRAFAVHPVQAFPQLLSFLRVLGERRLVEGSLDDEVPPR